MDNDIVDKHVFKAVLPKTPRKFLEVRQNVHRSPIEMREVDRSLQRLRRAGKIKYLKKADGGPGWVRA